MLLQQGHAVHVVDRFPRPASFDDAVTYVQGDLVDLDASAIVSADPEVIYHLAAAFERSTENPDFWLQNARDNVIASQQVLAAACKSPSLRRYVFASSYLVYDSAQFLMPDVPQTVVPLSETSLIDPRNACGAAKLLHEKEAHLAAEGQPFTVVSARIYRVYGQSSRDVVSRWIRSALAGESVSLFGQESFFDYIHARDVAEGLHRLAAADVEGAVNLGSGRSERVSAMVENIVRHFPDFGIDGPHPAETYEASEANVAKLEAVTGWRPRISLEEGVAELVSHERGNLRAGTVSRRVVEPDTATIMISSVSRKAPLIRAVRAAMESSLSEGTVGGADTDASVPTRPMLDWFWHMPRLDDLSDDELVDGCQERSVTVLIPTRDGELQRLASLRDRLDAVGTFVPIGSEASVVDALDKLATSAVCLAAGIPAIPTATSLAEVDSHRFVVKDRRGAGSRHIAIDVDAGAARDAFDTMVDPVVQPFIEGDEFSIDVYVRRDGVVVAAAVRQRVLVVNGEAQVTRQVARPDIDELARAALRALDIRGHAIVQVIDGPIGPQLVEVNSRLGGASTAGFAAGVNSIEFMLAEARGDVPEPVSVSTRPMVELTRLPSDTIRYR